MTVTLTPGAIKKFRRTPWRFQQTVEIPQGLNGRAGFASAIAAAHGRIEEATVIIDEIVFDVERMTALCPSGSPLPLSRESSLLVAREEVETLLAAAFIDGPDFIFIPTPKPFVFYADHDDWVTFYANTKSHLNHIIEPLASRGYKLVENWQREL